MHLKLFDIDLELLADAFEATLFSIEQGILELVVNLFELVKVFCFQCEILLQLKKLIESLQTIDAEPEI